MKDYIVRGAVVCGATGLTQKQQKILDLVKKYPHKSYSEIGKLIPCQESYVSKVMIKHSHGLLGYRRRREHQESYSIIIRHTEEKRRMPCLCCDRPFLSYGKGNRMCPACREASVGDMGGYEEYDSRLSNPNAHHGRPSAP